MGTAHFMTGGDVAPGRKNGSGMFGEIAARFRQADVSFLNLENALSEKGELLRGKPFYHRGNPSHVDGLVEAGFSCVNIANNHILDFGEPALFETVGELDRKAIGHFGAARNLDEARRCYILEKNGIRFGFLGYSTTLPIGFAATPSSAGVNPLQVHTAYRPRANPFEYPGVTPSIVTWTEPADLQRLRDDVGALRKQVAVVIVYLHWGSSMTPYVHDFQREIARTAIDAGAHAIFGGHQHVMSAIEFYKGCPIVHCSGNLLFDKWEPFFTDETLKTFLFGATVDRDGLHDCYLLPAKNGVGTPPRLLSRRDPLWQEIFDDLQAMCRDLDTRLVAREDAVEVATPQCSSGYAG
jgi:poly-gamma-glutamate capsule biosynthesis protein CapA/YwtB (metallophosphatase superfamily)